MTGPGPSGRAQGHSEVPSDCPPGPNHVHMQNWHFIVVTAPPKRAELAKSYRKGWELYLPMPFSVSNLSFGNPTHQAMQSRVGDSAQYLTDNIEKMPTLVIPCFAGQVESESNAIHAAMWGTIAPAAWKFMLAVRARRLGTAWTSVHIFYPVSYTHLTLPTIYSV